MSRPRALALIVAFVLALSLAAAGDSPVGAVGGLFDPAAARPPRAGEWLEYLVAFPVDPLENRLRSTPIPPPRSAAVSPADKSPAFVLPTSWRVLPLRLEVRSVGADAVTVRLTFAGVSRDIDMPLSSAGRQARFHYDPPQPEPQRAQQSIDGYIYDVEILIRRAENHGFARMSSPELPFGIARFATRDIDLILVGLGEGPPPPFPLSRAAAVEPPPGLFYLENDD